MESTTLREPGKPRDTTEYPVVLGRKVLLSQRITNEPSRPLYVDPRYVASLYRIRDNGTGINYADGNSHAVNETVLETAQRFALVEP